MVESHVQLPADGVGKKLHTFENVIGANTVQDEGVVLVTSAGVEKAVSLEATQVLAEAHLGTIDTSTAAAEVHVGNIETDLALVHTHVAGVETQDTEINAHVHALDAELVLVHAHIGTIDTAIGEINAHIHVLQGTDCKRAYVNAQADGDILALVAGKKIRVHALYIISIDTSSGYLRTNNVGGAILFKWSFAATGGAVLPFNPIGWFETAAGEALYGDFVVGAETAFVITYSEV